MSGLLSQTTHQTMVVGVLIAATVNLAKHLSLSAVFRLNTAVVHAQTYTDGAIYHVRS